ncbi:Hcp family type VI secretion system effector [Paenibacillus solisilvae]|uniref:Hcp family type VI secretion system effector n=1 Tax=Paenibacillus solisilvae TaxID=2486751 RepID=A0ABW0VVF7_9BACL
MRKYLLSIFAACLLVLTFSVVPAAAADGNNHVYLKLEGISGDSVDKRYEKWIDLSSVSYQISGKLTAFDPSHADGKISFNSFIFKKNFDSSSIPLMLNEFKGTHISKGKIAFTRQAGKGQEVEFLTFEFENIVVSSYSFDDLTESIAIKFGKIKWTYWPIDSKGNPAKTPIQGGWDLEKNGDSSPSKDMTAPVTQSTFTPVRSTKNKVTALTVKLTAADSGSGVSRTEYRINGGGWVTYTDTFTVQAAAAHNLEWRSIDKAGNVEKTWFADFDKGTPPRQI